MTDAPYRLKLLGGLGLEGPKKISGRVAQRRQMALLALLAGHEDPLTRDKLIGHLWPEASPDRARHQLSDALYVIRKELGEDAILLSGDSLELNPAVVRSDVADVRAALAGESYAEALANYGGPFLDGFFPDGSEPFERWMADERTALERAAARAAWTLVDRAEEAGEIHEAVRWARRALQIVPDDERGVRHLIRLQGAQGNRAGAIRTYQEFVDRLERELQIEPSRETQALIGAVRAGEMVEDERSREPEPAGTANKNDRGREPAGPIRESVETVVENDAPPRAHVQPARTPTPPPARPADRHIADLTRRQVRIAGILVGALAVAGVAYLLIRDPVPVTGPGEAVAAPAIAVLPFRVGSEELETWREGMVDLLSTNLDGIPGLRAIDSHTMLARWRGMVEGDEILDAEIAIGIAHDTGARYAILGSVVAAGEAVRIVAELYDAESARRLSSAQVEGVVDSIFGLVDELSIELLQGIVDSEEDLAAIDLARATTTSLPALRAYLEGEVHMRHGDFIPAVEAYERAVAADSTFALAWLQLSVANAWGAVLPGASYSRMIEAMDRSLRYAERLSERDAFRVRGWAVLPELGTPLSASERLNGLDALRELTRRYPDDVMGWFTLGDFAFHLSGPLLLDPALAPNAFERAIQIDPGFVPAYGHFIADIMRTDPDSARVAELMAIENSLVPPEATSVAEGRIIRTLAFGRPGERDPTIAAIDTVSACTLCIANLYFTHPRHLDIQTDLLRSAVSEDSWEPTLAAPWLFRTVLSRGRLSDALEVVESPFDMDELLFIPHVSGYPIPTERLEAALGPEPEKPRYRFPTVAGQYNSASVMQHVFRGAWALEQKRTEVFGKSLFALRSLEEEWLNDPDSLSGEISAGFAAGGIDALEGYRAWNEGRTEDAAELLDRARLRTATEWYPLNIVVRWWQAQMALEANELDKAAEYLLSLSHGESITTDPWATFRLAQVQEDLGLHDEARANYAFFALAWRDADPRFQPLVQQARRAVVRLRGLRRE